MADSNITKNALAAALKKLMTESSFDKISVSEICEECGMNRKSFYYHFKDKYDLVNWIFYDDFLANLQTASFENGWDALKALIGRFYEERSFYLEALKIEGQNSFHDYVIETIKPLVCYFTADIFSGNPKNEFFYTFFGDAFLISVRHWLQDEIKLSPEEFVDSFRDILLNIAGRL